MKQVLQTLDCFTKDIETILGSNLRDIVVHGSYVLGDFRPNQGDLDYLVVTNTNLDATVNAKLFDLHDDYRRTKSLLLHQLEGTYYPTAFLSGLLAPFVGCYIGTSRAGWRTITTFQNSYMDLRIIEECGQALLGNSFSLYYPSEADVRNEQELDLQKYQAGATEGAGWDAGRWISLIHWCARTIYYVETDHPASKGKSCRWCGQDPRFSEFARLFSLAENRRYPYADADIDEDTRDGCRRLLRRVGDAFLGTNSSLF
jgi:hypothetical protein